MTNMLTAELFGNQYTRTFAEIFPDAETFYAEWEASGIGAATSLTKSEVELTFYLMYARYGNSHIASFDETQFKYKVWSIMYTDGQTWARKVQLQKEIRDLSVEDLALSKAIHNHSYNPGTEPSTASLEELITIDQQNTTTTKRNKGDAYSVYWSLLNTNFSEEYLSKFRRLFIKFVNPALPLWYITDKGDNV